MFTELPFLERFAAAARAGFDAVEYAYPDDATTQEISVRLHDNNLKLVLINTPRGNFAAGELGLAVLPGREKELHAGFNETLETAIALDVPLIHLLAGKPPAGSNREATDALYLENITRAADLAAQAGRTITLEPLNERDRSGYHLKTNAHARALIEAAGRHNVKLQLDLYHCQIAEGDLIRNIERHIDIIAHVQTASVPERAEPILGEINHANVMKRLDDIGYKGYVGCEYSPAAGTLPGLGWAEPYLQ
jgi:hydroxypyruvate isomerase